MEVAVTEDHSQWWIKVMPYSGPVVGQALFNVSEVDDERFAHAIELVEAWPAERPKGPLLELLRSARESARLTRELLAFWKENVGTTNEQF